MPTASEEWVKNELARLDRLRRLFTEKVLQPKLVEFCEMNGLGMPENVTVTWDDAPTNQSRIVCAGCWLATPDKHEWHLIGKVIGDCDQCKLKNVLVCAMIPRQATVQIKPTRDWTEDFGRENGKYMGRCVMCGHTFTGHKSRQQCRLCSTS